MRKKKYNFPIDYFFFFSFYGVTFYSNYIRECAFEKCRCISYKMFRKKCRQEGQLKGGRDCFASSRSCFMRTRPAGNAFVTYSYAPKTAVIARIMLEKGDRWEREEGCRAAYHRTCIHT